MAGRTRKPDKATVPSATEDGVKAYLEKHPDFFVQNSELFKILEPPEVSRGENVFDMQQFMVRRLQSEIDRLQDLQKEMIQVGRSNMSVQRDIHNAILAILEASSLSHMVHIIVHDLPQILELDAVTLGVEADQELLPSAIRVHGVHILEPGSVKRLIGAKKSVRMVQKRGHEALFGPAAGLVESQALARLQSNDSLPPGLVAFGSRDPERFHPGQATDLMMFLAKVVERRIRGWLLYQR